MDIILSLKGIDKRFQAVHALKNICLDVYSGDTLGLVGENGAGKSTLVKILTGAHKKDSGEIIFNGHKVEISGPPHAKSLGISQAYQRAEYIPELTVAENIFLGETDFTKKGLVSWKKMFDISQDLLDAYGLNINAHVAMIDLSVAECQLVTIIKMLRRKPKLIIFDEPTAVLADREVEILFKMIRKLQEEKVSIIYISHRLEEVFQLSNRIAVMRDGNLVTVLENKGITNDRLVEYMLGRKLDTMFPPKIESVSSTEVFRVEDLTNENIHNISFALYKGEILGIIGLVGSQRTELLKAIYGVDKLHYGKIYIDGNQVYINSPRAAISNGIFLAPEDRKGEGIVPERSIRENVTYSNLNGFYKNGCLEKKKEIEYVNKINKQIDIKAPTIETLCSELSGGNQQKVVVAKSLTANPKILMIDEPTQGIDVGAKAEIYSLINDLAQKGMSVIIVSSEMEEAIGLTNRIIVMNEGRIVGESIKEEMNSKTLISMMYRSVINENTNK